MIIPLAHCRVHEGVVPGRVNHIAADLVKTGAMRVPLLVTRVPGTADQWIVIDGMHRVAACRQLELKYVAAYEVDYYSPAVILEGWSAFTAQSIHPAQLMPQLFPVSAGHILNQHTWATAAQLQDKINQRAIILAVADRDQNFWALEKPDLNETELLDYIIQTTQQLDAALDQLSPIYVPDRTALADVATNTAAGLALRPRFSKKEVIARTLKGQLFPHKSTHHIVPQLPLHVDVPISQLS